MMRIVAAGLTDVGRMREENQDCFGDFEIPDGLDHPGPGGRSPSRASRLVIVADGVGGHRGGKVASRMAVDSLLDAYRRQAQGDSTGPPRTIDECLVAAFRDANRRIFEKAEQDDSLLGMASTCTALVLQGGTAHVAHLGDSRAYLVRKGSVRSLTRDHSVVQSRVDAGLLTAEEARTHNERNIITRSLGFEPDIDPELLQPPLPVQQGDRFVLSTDGLHGVLSDAEIGEIVARGTPTQACRLLVDTANDRGGPDNVTVVVLHVEDL